ncbi:MAG: sigma-70 family RNA polymerase sigma factor [Flavobacteriales bacterium]
MRGVNVLESNTNELADHLFRREAGKMVASLTRFFGSKHLELAEDVVQDTLLKAMQEWPFKGIPDNPEAWLHRVARNGVIDKLRRDARGLDLLRENAVLLRSEWTLAATVHSELNASAISDDQLRMFFACCHPSLAPEQQVALALKTLCGFGVPEIARAFVTSEETINKRLYRAREAFRALGQLEIPQGAELNDRLGSVLSTIYLLFNEGYNATRHENLIREDVIEEALRLCQLLLDHPTTQRPEVHALLALMIFHAARSEARIDTDGAIVLLQDQDRSQWDRALIALGNEHLSRASAGELFTTYHLEAIIASLHANAITYASTDWRSITRMYDELFRMKPSPIVALNRAIAVAEVDGPLRGLDELDRITGLEQQHLFHAVRGDLLQRAGRNREARAAFEHALRLTSSPMEHELLTRKLQTTEKAGP